MPNICMAIVTNCINKWFGTPWFCHYCRDVTQGVVTVGVNICIGVSYVKTMYEDARAWQRWGGNLRTPCINVGIQNLTPQSEKPAKIDTQEPACKCHAKTFDPLDSRRRSRPSWMGVCKKSASFAAAGVSVATPTQRRRSRLSNWIRTTNQKAGTASPLLVMVIWGHI